MDQGAHNPQHDAVVHALEFEVALLSMNWLKRCSPTRLQLRALRANLRPPPCIHCRVMRCDARLPNTLRPSPPPAQALLRR